MKQEICEKRVGCHVWREENLKSRSGNLRESSARRAFLPCRNSPSPAPWGSWSLWVSLCQGCWKAASCLLKDWSLCYQQGQAWLSKQQADRWKPSVILPGKSGRQRCSWAWCLLGGGMGWGRNLKEMNDLFICQWLSSPYGQYSQSSKKLLLAMRRQHVYREPRIKS